MPIQELPQYELSVVKQTAKGSPATTFAGGKRLIQVGGDFNAPREDGSEPWSDGSKYGSQTDWVNTLLGNGTPNIEATASELAYLLYLACGGEAAPVAAVSEQQTVTVTGTPTGGTFTLTFKNQTTAPIAFNATAANVVTALVALTKIGAGGVTATGGPLPGTAVVLTFALANGGRDQPLITADASGLTGGSSPAVAVTETVAGSKTRHRFTPPALGAAPIYSSWYTRVGSSAGVIKRWQMNDCRLGQFSIGGSSDRKAIWITPTILSLDPAVWKTATPTGIPAIPTNKQVFLFTHAHAAYTIDGNIIQGLASFEFIPTEDLQTAYATDTSPFDVYSGNPGVTINTTLWIDAGGLQQFNNIFYGTPTPAADQKPLKDLPALGNFSLVMKHKDADGVTGDRLDLNQYGVKWNIPDSPGPNPQGGAASLNLTGGGRISGSNPMFQIDVYNDDTAAY